MRRTLILSEQAPSHSKIRSVFQLLQTDATVGALGSILGVEGVSGRSSSRSSDPFAKRRIFPRHLLGAGVCSPPKGCGPSALVPRLTGKAGCFRGCCCGGSGPRRRSHWGRSEDARMPAARAGAGAPTNTRRPRARGGRGRGGGGLTRSMNVRNFQLPP